jgi:hypothetical protein
MNTITAVYNVYSKVWTVNTGTLTGHNNELAISFISGTGEAKTRFDGLQFGYELRQNGLSILSENYPKTGQKLLSADTYPVAIINLYLRANENYELHLYAVNSGQRIEQNTEFSVPKSTQPYASWGWNNELKEWEAPTPAPKDFPHEWNEALESWVRRDMPM